MVNISAEVLDRNRDKLRDVKVIITNFQKRDSRIYTSRNSVVEVDYEVNRYLNKYLCMHIFTHTRTRNHKENNDNNNNTNDNFT